MHDFKTNKQTKHSASQKHLKVQFRVSHCGVFKFMEHLKSILHKEAKEYYALQTEAHTAMPTHVIYNSARVDQVSV